jgi:hypothetical protein
MMCDGDEKDLVRAACDVTIFARARAKFRGQEKELKA